MSFCSVFRTFAVCIVFSFLAAPAGAADDTAAARRILTRLFALPPVSTDRKGPSTSPRRNGSMTVVSSCSALSDLRTNYDT